MFGQATFTSELLLSDVEMLSLPSNEPLQNPEYKSPRDEFSGLFRVGQNGFTVSKSDEGKFSMRIHRS